MFLICAVQKSCFQKNTVLFGGGANPVSPTSLYIFGLTRSGSPKSFLFKQKLKTTTTTEISTTTTTPIGVFWFENFYVEILFRAMFLFSSFRDLSTKVICKAATDLRKFQRKLTRRTIFMLMKRHTRLWTENCIFLEDDMMAQRYFSICLRFRKTAKLLLEIINQKRLKIK